MKRWIKRSLFGLIGFTALAGGVAACSHHRHGAWSMSEADATKFRERMLDRVGKELDLDSTQKQSLATLAEKLRAHRNAIKGTTTDPRTEAQALISGAKFDRDRARNLIETKTAAVRESSPDTVAAAADFFDSLKPEQQQRVREFLAKRHRGWFHRG
jgi:periplasmic protein CpxP/Spy